jgi:hypothetical protein
MKTPLQLYYGDAFEGRVNEGATIIHDRDDYTWPSSKVGPNADKDTVFKMEWTSIGLACEAVGFGLPPCYGNGGFSVPHEEDVTLIKSL